MNDFSIDSSYVILINDDNSMTTTRKRRIMQNSNLVDILCFLIHPDYAENDMENFSVSLHYHLPVSSIEVNEDLTLSDNTYGGYLLYKLPIDTGLTVESGDIPLSLTFSYKYIDENGNEIARIRKVSGAKLQIEGSSIIKPTPDYGGNVDFQTDETLTLKNGILSVNTTNDMEQDNTLPITSAGVFATVGNIEALLKTI